MSDLDKDEAVNVLGEPLEECGANPVTGFYRDGYCNTCKEDVDSHTVCIEVSQSFLEYSSFKGNDLSKPMPEYGFAGLKPGDSWCLCAARWLEAQRDNMAPRVHLMGTHKKSLEIVPMEIMRQFAVDLN